MLNYDAEQVRVLGARPRRQRRHDGGQGRRPGEGEATHCRASILRRGIVCSVTTAFTHNLVIFGAGLLCELAGPTHGFWGMRTLPRSRRTFIVHHVVY
jgi:hypothetical protein